MKIYHNPRCRKSRETLAILKGAGIEPDIVLYLEKGFEKPELQSLLKSLGMQPSEILRKGEAIFKENFKGKKFSEEEWLEVLLANPKLVERPIVLSGNKAVLGRPPENVNILINK